MLTIVYHQMSLPLSCEGPCDLRALLCSHSEGPGAALPLNTQHSLCRTLCELKPAETAAGHVCKCCKLAASRLSVCSLHITHVSPRCLRHL